MNGQSRLWKPCHQLTGAACVIEVDMRKDQPVDMRGIQAYLSKRIEHSGHGVVGATIDKGAMSVMDEEISRIESGPYETGVDGVNVM
jgi:hypothetical protein